MLQVSGLGYSNELIEHHFGHASTSQEDDKPGSPPHVRFERVVQPPKNENETHCNKPDDKNSDKKVAVLKAPNRNRK